MSGQKDMQALATSNNSDGLVRKSLLHVICFVLVHLMCVCVLVSVWGHRLRRNTMATKSTPCGHMYECLSLAIVVLYV